MSVRPSFGTTKLPASSTVQECVCARAVVRCCDPSATKFVTIPPQDTTALLRRALVGILLVGHLGSIAELLLLKHIDGFWQLIPLGLSVITLMTLLWFGVAQSVASLRTLQGTMWLCLLSGVTGVVQHLLGNIVYAQESNPSISGRDLYLEAIMGSTPTLAPGVMVLLGLIGLAFAFRHPILSPSILS